MQPTPPQPQPTLNAKALAVLESQIKTTEQRKRQFTYYVATIALVLVGLLIGLGTFLSIFVSWKIWSSTLIGAGLELIPAGVSWWLVKFTKHYQTAAWITSVSALIVLLGVYWEDSSFAIYLFFTLLLLIIRMILGRSETAIAFAILLFNTLLNTIINNNSFPAPDGQIVKLGYGSLVEWWLAVGVITWLTSALHDLIESDSRTLKQQASALQQALTELQQKQTTNQTESQRIHSLGLELDTIAKQQFSESQQEVTALTQATEVIEEMSHTATTIKTQSYQVQETAQAVGGLAGTIQKTFVEVLAAGQAGAEATFRTVSATSQVEAQYLQLRTHLTELAFFQNQIRSVVDSINAISEETHLLSLNAAIEAAGAGTYGERFAVVADEVKNLAQRAQHSSTQVSHILGQVESGITQVATVAESAQSQIGISLTASSECSQMMSNIIAAIGRNVQQVEQISGAVQQISQQSSAVDSASTQQSVAANQAAQNLRQIMNVAVRNSQVSNQLSQSASTLALVSTNLAASLALT
jgi:methyl-accepting chemotaxis protein